MSSWNVKYFGVSTALCSWNCSHKFSLRLTNFPYRLTKGDDFRFAKLLLLLPVLRSIGLESPASLFCNEATIADNFRCSNLVSLSHESPLSLNLFIPVGWVKKGLIIFFATRQPLRRRQLQVSSTALPFIWCAIFVGQGSLSGGMFGVRSACRMSPSARHKQRFVLPG